MAINIGKNSDGDVTYQNPPVNRVLFPNITEYATAEAIEEFVNAWLDDHPEATTTVEDGSILPVKLDSSNSPSDGYVLSYNATEGKFEWYDVGGELDEINSDISDLKQDLNRYSGLFPMVSGYINANTRTVYPNDKRVTTGVMHLENPFTISIGTGWQLVYLVGGATGALTDKGWTIVNGGSHHFTLADGEYFAFTLAKTSLEVIDATTAFVDSKFRLIFDNTNDYQIEKSIDSIKSVIDAIEVRPVYYVDATGNGDYTSILEALKSTPNLSHIIVRKGEYDMQSEYEDYYDSDYFTNYSGYDLSDIFSRGYFIDGGRIFECEAGAKIVFRYEGNNEYVNRFFSVINTGMNITLKGCHIYYKNLRYAIHDDYAQNNEGTNYFENIIVEGFPSGWSGNHWGGGCGKKNTYVLNNVVFLDGEMPSNYGDIYYHNNEGSGAVNRIVVNNCCGERGCQFIWIGQSQEISYAMVSGCSFSAISARAYDETALYENMKLIKYNNTETA